MIKDVYFTVACIVIFWRKVDHIIVIIAILRIILLLILLLLREISHMLKTQGIKIKISISIVCRLYKWRKYAVLTMRNSENSINKVLMIRYLLITFCSNLKELA